MHTAKKTVRRLLDDLPDNASLEDIQYHAEDLAYHARHVRLQPLSGHIAV
jgi:hypothetical protein